MRLRSFGLSAGILGTVVFASGAWAVATLRPDTVKVADAKKTDAYVQDGMIVGGDRAIGDVVVRDIRRAANPKYERLVLDLQGTRNGEPAAIQRPPYFQVSVSPDEKRLIFTLWGNPKLEFNAKKILGALKKSRVVQDIEFYPKLDRQTWTFAVGLKTGRQVEVFELSNPVRIIMDIRTERAKVGQHSVKAPETLPE